MSDILRIGCRISIISKAQIRYEGYLHSIDCDTPGEPVITLSKVWSFGTEDRPCERPAAPRNEEYALVAFRGRDLVNVFVLQSSMYLNQDSAVISATPGSSSSKTPTNENRPDHTNPADLDSPTSGIPSLMGCDSVSLDMLSHNSSTVPQSLSVMPRPGPIGTLHSDRPQPVDNRGPRPFGDGRSDADITMPSGSAKYPPSQATQPDTFYDSHRSRTVVGSNNHLDVSQTWPNKVTSLSGGPADNRWRNNVSSRDQLHRRRPVYNQRSGSSRGYGYSSGNHKGSRGYFGWSRPRNGPQNIFQTEFSGEYDYEKANAVLAAELEKITITTSKPSSAADGENGKSDESGGSLAGEESSYDKAKPFYDTLSSELTEKTNGLTSQRMTRRDERLLNSTTFGMQPNYYPRRRGNGGYRRSSGNYGSYSYGQRRTGGGFPRQYGAISSNKESHNHDDTILSSTS